VRLRCGRPLTFPRVEAPTPRLATAVTARVWPVVELLWISLGGTQRPAAEVEPHPPLRRAA
jgi:hypothetical protein